MMSKCVVFGYFILLQVHAIDLADYLKKKPGFEKCATANTLDINAFKDNPTSPEVLCFAKCMIEEKGVLDADGNVKTEQLVDDKDVADMTPEEMEGVESMKVCLKNVVIKTCEDMYQFGTCFEDIFKHAWALTDLGV
nr:unnamed protein product [Callosobruchus analis]